MDHAKLLKMASSGKNGAAYLPVIVLDAIA